MARDIYNDEVMIRYLLKKLPADVENEIDEKIFADTDYFARLLEIEEKLIEDNARGKLSNDTDQQFKHQYSSDLQWTLKVETQQALTGAKDSPPVTVSWWQTLMDSLRNPKIIRQLAFVSTVLALTIGIFFFVMKERRRQDDNRVSQLSNQPVAPQPSPNMPATPNTPDNPNSSGHTNGNPTEQGTRVKQPNGTERATRATKNQNVAPSPVPLAIATLVPGALRGNEDYTSVEMTPGESSVPIRVVLREKIYPSYRVVLKTRDGQDVWSRREIKPSRSGSQASIILQVPAEILTQKYYRLHLYSGEQEIDYYPFQVTKK
jgi:hypothetical protein